MNQYVTILTAQAQITYQKCMLKLDTLIKDRSRQMRRLSDDTMNVSDSEERLKQVQSTQDTAMKKTHTTAVVIQEATAIIEVEETTTNLEEAVIHVAEATIAMAGVEEITTTIEMATAIQEARQRHIRGPEVEVIEAAIET